MCEGSHNHKNRTVWQSFYHELLHHFPYATMSVALALMLLTLIHVLFYSDPHTVVAAASSCCGDSTSVTTQSIGLDALFHCFHFTHILFATSGTIITFRRYSQRMFVGLLVGTFSSMVFCTLSDVLLPYLAGRMLGVEMDLHICFSSELANILPFLLVGVLNGWVMSQLPEFRTQENSLFLHFLHTFISAMASIFYAVGHGLSDFDSYFGLFFLLMVIAVILPCTLSDVIAPIFFANFVEKKKVSKA